MKVARNQRAVVSNHHHPRMPFNQGKTIVAVGSVGEVRNCS